VLDDDDTIDIGYPVRIVHSPGHSKDSLSVYLPDERILISGDAIPYVCDVPIYDDLPSLKASLKKMAALPVDTVLSGFCGLWSQKKDGNIFSAVEGYLATIQEAVDAYLETHETYELSNVGKYVIECLGVDSAPIPIFLRSVEEHIRCRTA
jgi:glyoxylase-like metal-dependent hydrolase (beta-lactamase superfamily II)